jgi:hypothetical protein
MPGMMIFQGDQESMVKAIGLHLSETNVEKTYLDPEGAGNHLFYVTYKDGYESEFYHGFNVTCFDSDTSSTYTINEENEPELVSEVNRMIHEHSDNSKA